MIEQDGKAVVNRNGEVTLRRAPFTVIVRFLEMTNAKVHVSQFPAGYELVRTNAPGEDLHPPGFGWVEEDRNPAQALYLSAPAEPAYHSWPFPGGSYDRFDATKPDGGAVIARRNVAAFIVMPDRIRHTVEQFPGDVIYLVSRLIGSVSGAEVQRQGLKLTFAGKPVPSRWATAAASGPGANDQEVIATVEGRQITAGTFRKHYRQTMHLMKNAYGDRINDDTLEQLRNDLRVIQSLVDEEAALVEAERRGIAVTDAEIRASIESVPAFQEKNRFGEARFRKILASQTPPITPEQFFESMRRSLIAEKLQLAVTKGLEGMARVDAYEAYLRQAKEKMQIVVNHEVLKRIVAEK